MQADQPGLDTWPTTHCYGSPRVSARFLMCRIGTETPPWHEYCGDPMMSAVYIALPGVCM